MSFQRPSAIRRKLANGCYSDCGCFQLFCVLNVCVCDSVCASLCLCYFLCTNVLHFIMPLLWLLRRFSPDTRIILEASVLFITFFATDVVEHLWSDVFRSLSFCEQLHFQHAGMYSLFLWLLLLLQYVRLLLEVNNNNNNDNNNNKHVCNVCNSFIMPSLFIIFILIITF